MDTRSTNAVGYTHFIGDLTAHVGSSHGARLSGGSTGGVVEAVGDDDNISMTIRGKGTGLVRLGNSSQAIVSTGVTSTHFAIASTRVTVGSTFGFGLIQRVIVQIDSAALVVAAEGTSDTVSTVTGATTNSLCIFMPHATFSTRYTFQAFCSTADEVRIRLFNTQATTFGSGQSSNRGTLFVIA